MGSTGTSCTRRMRGGRTRRESTSIFCPGVHRGLRRGRSCTGSPTREANARFDNAPNSTGQRADDRGHRQVRGRLYSGLQARALSSMKMRRCPSTSPRNSRRPVTPFRGTLLTPTTRVRWRSPTTTVIRRLPLRFRELNDGQTANPLDHLRGPFLGAGSRILPTYSAITFFRIRNRSSQSFGPRSRTQRIRVRTRDYTTQLMRRR